MYFLIDWGDYFEIHYEVFISHKQNDYSRRGINEWLVVKALQKVSFASIFFWKNYLKVS